jgi:alkylated DNA nucleotide flippase Atl1
MAKKTKSWKEKLEDSKGLPKIEKINSKLAGRWKTKVNDTLVIPAPLEVDAIMKKVPKGKLITINDIRAMLARKHKAAICCPLTTGIFARIAAEAAVEAEKNGEKNVTPYWRTLKAKGVINEKYPGGIMLQKKLLEKEGHKVMQKGKKFVVVDFEQNIADYTSW